MTEWKKVSEWTPENDSLITVIHDDYRFEIIKYYYDCFDSFSSNPLAGARYWSYVSIEGLGGGLAVGRRFHVDLEALFFGIKHYYFRFKDPDILLKLREIFESEQSKKEKGKEDDV